MERKKPDWSLLEVFLEVGREGSHTAAAEKLGTSQPTISRKIQQLEDELGVALLIRHSRGFELTEAGRDLFAAALEIEAGVSAFMRRAETSSSRISGTVRISAAGPVAIHTVIPCARDLQETHRDLAIELVVDTKPSDLSRRVADIAVRMFRPQHLDLVATKTGEAQVGLYASRDYLRRRGRPDSIEDRAGHVIIGNDHDPRAVDAMRALGYAMARNSFTFRTDSYLAQLAAIRAGVGIGAAQTSILDCEEDCVRLWPEIKLPAMEMWVVMHRETRNVPAFRAIFDSLVCALREKLA